MAVDFCDYFWGEEHNGWNVLYQNMKQGHNASKELAEFFKERGSIDETYCKALYKLANKANINTEKGTLAPIFALLKISSEKMSTVHLHMVNKIQDLVKDVLKYNEEVHKKQKTVKDEESQTEDIVKSIQITSTLAQKAKETYNQRCQDLEKLKREGASPKDVEKAEAKLRKAHDEYKALVDKYNVIRDEFEKRMLNSCKKFQMVEETHLSQIMLFVQTYIDVLQSDRNAMGLILQELVNKYSQLTIDKLLDSFVLNKLTGLEKPVMMVFEDACPLESGISGQQSPEPTSDHPKQQQQHQQHQLVEESSSGGEKSLSGSVLTGGFLRSRRDKKKEKKSKKKKDTDSSSIKDDKSDNENSEEAKTADLISVGGSKEETVERDEKVGDIEEGGKEADEEVGGEDTLGSVGSNGESEEMKLDDENGTSRSNKDILLNKDNSFDSSSDSDSEIGIEKKIHVEIKPITNGAPPISASVDELRATIEGMSLSPLGYSTSRRSNVADSHDRFMKKSSSTTQQIGLNSNDFLGLNLNLSTNSSASPKFGSKEQSQDGSGGSNEINEILGETSSHDSTPPILPPRSVSSRGSTPTPTMAIPRPSSRKFESARSLQSPAVTSVLSRTESVSSLEFRTSGMNATGLSRGPSPLTIGMADTIPLAVAFQELCHAYFRGTDENRVQIKITGEMMVSFPAGIVGVLANNPSPAQLSFKIQNFSKIANPLPNKQLITFDESQSSKDNGVYNFCMASLSSLLRRQAEQNPSASYFNVDIIKYQVNVAKGVESCPLHMVSYWRCEDDHTDLKIDYKYNEKAMNAPCSLLNIAITVPVDGVVRNMHSRPSGQWVKEQQKAIWKMTELSQNSSDCGKGSLRGKFEVAAGPSTPATVTATFNCEGTTLSGLEFGLIGNGYRVSLVKKRFVSGKYICDADAVLKLKYGVMPS